MKRALLIGYGDIAQRTARLLIESGWQVTGICRHPDKKPTMPGIQLLAADAGNEVDLRRLQLSRFDAIVITLTPSGYDREGYHHGYVIPCRHIQTVLASEPARESGAPRLLYISSTGVYSERDGEWITEQTPSQPDTDSGQMLLQAEQVIQSAAATVSILRCSGIYGPGRIYLQRQISAGEAVINPVYNNRIHADDVAGFIHYLLQHPEQQESLYLVSDDEPVWQETLYLWYAEQLGVDGTKLQRSATIGPRGNKRINNALMRSTGYVLRHPTYRD
ncbi:MAG TPA: NAD(P)H-binding protein [Pseudidiomarina sp.]|nr:NAD(P)H-binding protein [Pseudidiomarina sp.]